MSATLQEVDAPVHELADAPDVVGGIEQYPLTLTDRLPARFKVTGTVAAYVFVLSLLFGYVGRQPLGTADLFGNLEYGQRISQTGAIPRTEPFLPLSEGIPVVDSAWLSQWVGYRVFRATGYPGLQFLNALCVTAVLTLLVRRLHQRTRHGGLTFLGLGAVLLIGWESLLVARPQVAGTTCFALLLFLLTTRRWSWFHWVAIPLLMGVWANLHGSFTVGLLTLGCLTVGRAWDLWWRGGWAGIVHDRVLRRLLLVSQLAVVATLVNPYGLRLYVETFALSAHPNLEELPEWQPLYVRSWGGLATLAALVGLAIAYRRSPRRIPAGEVLLLVLLGFSGLWTSRMLLWFGPVAAGCLIWNLHARRLFDRDGEPYAPAEGNSRWSLVAVVCPWIFFAVTPLAMVVLHKAQPSVKSTLSSATPLGAAEFLKENPRQGLVFSTVEFGDYLHWAGPEGIKLLVNSQIQWIPTDVWRDYNKVVNVQSDWQGVLDKHGVNTLVLDRQERRALLSRLKDNQDWQKVYEDDVSAIHFRKKPI